MRSPLYEMHVFSGLLLTVVSSVLYIAICDDYEYHRIELLRTPIAFAWIHTVINLYRSVVLQGIFFW